MEPPKQMGTDPNNISHQDLPHREWTQTTSSDIVKLKVFVLYLFNVSVSSRSQIADDGSYGSPHTGNGSK
eukprot:scaffold99190_cov42-Attheya_sp.AAC.3